MTAKPGIRREIRDLKVNYPKQFDLYLLGLEKFQQVEESKPLSYFEISGMYCKYHGVPRVLIQPQAFMASPTEGGLIRDGIT